VIWREGRLAELAPGGASVEIAGDEPLSIFSRRISEDVKKGDDVIVGIRPESITLAKEKIAGESNQLPCLLEKRLFLGDRIECHLRYGNARFTLATPITESFSNGQKVCLCLPPDSVFIWTKPTGLTE